ncbi:putative nucleolar protein [Triangularia verruculosa]|uniref:Nucleolar protein n=1 Tax=Triangularia verruculosa TaxID=2587418 RepID=A0AAN6X8M8_9PEZI|nr:putative nucleolar protein [Triangularia verruculosa]
MAGDKKRQRDAEDAPIEATGSTGKSSNPPNKRARVDKNRSLFVRSLPPSATSESLTDFFSQYYPVKHATVVLDPKTKTSRGYGFVSFADPEDAVEAKNKLNNELLDGRRLRLDIAQPRLRDAAKASTEVAARVVTEKRQREEELAEQRKAPKLIIRNLPWSIKSSEQLAKLFQPFGKIKFADLPNAKGKLSGFGFVTLRGRKNAEKALEAINGKEIDGRTVAVDWAVDKQTWEQHREEEEEGGEDGKEAKAAKKKAKKAKKEDEEKEEDDPNMTQEDRDLANFFKNYGNNLEDEEEEDDEELNSEDEDEDEDEEKDDDEDEEMGEDDEFEDVLDEEEEEEEPEKKLSTDNSTTLFIRNLPYTATDEQLKAHFEPFGAVRYARVVKERGTDRPAGTGFVCFFNHDDFLACLKGAPRHRPAPTLAKHSVLQDETLDPEGKYTLDGRILQVAQAVDKNEAARLQEMSASKKDKDKRRLFLLQEGQISASSTLFKALSDQETKMREASAKQRKKLIESNPALHISLTRLAIRNIPADLDSKALKALAREAVVGFAKDVKEGKRAPLSKEENLRGGEQDKEAERHRKEKGKGVVKQAKIVFETVQGSKVDEKKAEGGGKSRGYGFIEYSSHRWALMGLRWLNGHALKNEAGKTQRLIVEFAIENANVVQRRRQHEQKIREEGPRAPGSRAEREKREKEREKSRKNRWGKREEEKKRPDTWNKSSKGKKSAVPKEEKGKKEPETKERRKSAETKLAMRTKIVARKREMRKKKSESRGKK